ncbi:ATP-binding protein [Streptomyces leeuwenhoekii]|uniref:ATP-binding protein n=1 Tax=Streptomyces leeuwenhoekii TaxID=1437453 RepID=UPI001F5D1CCA|nr:ATP-binding protein [Streptomyces leeuwenhoekii]
MPSVPGRAIVAGVIPSAPLGTDATGAPSGLGAASGAGPARAASERRFRFELAAHPGSPAQARRLTRARLTGWSVCEDTCDTAALVVSELVTNAIVHTAGRRVVCELHDGDDLVRIAVRDEGCGSGRPEAARRQPEDEHGRGLLLVDALSHAWGAHEHGPGLLVWAELPRTAGVPHQPTGSPCEPSSEPRGDLGWGTRPKPGTSGGQGDAGDTGGSDKSGDSGKPGGSGKPEGSGASGESAGSGDSGRSVGTGDSGGTGAAQPGHGENQTHHETRAAWL